MLNKLIESVTVNAVICTSIILTVGFILVRWFARMARKEEQEEELWDERSIYD